MKIITKLPKFCLIFIGFYSKTITEMLSEAVISQRDYLTHWLKPHFNSKAQLPLKFAWRYSLIVSNYVTWRKKGKQQCE